MKLDLGTSEVGPNGEVRLPAAKLKKYGIKPGDGLYVWVEDGVINISKSWTNSGEIKKPHK